ncbi:transcription elongation factor GreA [Candidatus Wolfebacteria bacterium CG10_big_fil_rev_8_21_14_0_10_31_9]|uniref:Transcription elongation factor GreA n=1 Tax=Candidatus Wolfebacteria bacterium CG10_big_fil_rev_8_21_14_0_10_31_9 TaxID=1975070 RepID=A0A2H0RDM8_9BACT|nr:MAG: transcription elongation factor GreA [Candidatus Wolfebacteria bacterium CG10_big_fil_rev_8_21_14_0_10_31_9]
MEYFLTKEKYEELKNELEHLQKEGRIDIADRLKKAKDYGDLSENAEYSEAKESQAQMEQHIVELENILRNSVIIKKTAGKGIIDLGATVKVEKNGKTLEYTIVGSNEADPDKNLISNESPLGRMFMGKKPGDVVEVETPKGKVKYKIMAIK